jgi:hypothetical protein
MGADVRLRDATGAADLATIPLPSTTPGTPSAPRAIALVNVGDRAAESIALQVLPNPKLTNLQGAPVVSVSPVNASAMPGAYALAFSLSGAQWRVSVNGSSAIAITADGATPQTGVIPGLAIVFSASLSASNQARIDLDDGHYYVQLAASPTTAPGGYAQSLSLGTLPPLNANLALAAESVADEASALPPGDYAYALVAVLTDGTTLPPVRVSVSASAGTKTRLSWGAPFSGVQAVRIYVGPTAGSEALLVELPPTATETFDTTGVPTGADAPPENPDAYVRKAYLRHLTQDDTPLAASPRTYRLRASGDGL